MALRNGYFRFQRNEESERIHLGSSEKVNHFVFVPKDYDFKSDTSISLIFKALEMESPEFIFNFLANHGLAPRSNDKKSILDWYVENNTHIDDKEKGLQRPYKDGKAAVTDTDQVEKGNNDQEELLPPNGSESIMSEENSKDPVASKELKEESSNGNEEKVDPKEEKEKKNLWTRRALESVPMEGTLFLISKPYKGNVLSRLAIEAAARKGIKTLALLTCDRNGSAGNKITYIENKKAEEKEAEEKQVDTNGNAIGEKGLDRYRKPIDETQFTKKDSRCCLPIGDKPTLENYIEAMTDYTKEEDKFYRKFSTEELVVRPFIPGLLVKNCSHILIFETQESLNVFHTKLSETLWCATIAAGNSLSELAALKSALHIGNPVIVLQDTGPVSDIATQIEIDRRKKRAVQMEKVLGEEKEKDKRCRDSKKGKFKNSNDLINMLDDHFEREKRKLKFFLRDIGELEGSGEEDLLTRKNLLEEEVNGFHNRKEERSKLKSKVQEYYQVEGESHQDLSAADAKSFNKVLAEAYDMCVNIETLCTDDPNNVCIIAKDSNCCHTNGEKIMKLMSIDFSNNEVMGFKKDNAAISFGRNLQKKLQDANKRYYNLGLIFNIVIIGCTAASVFFASVYKKEYRIFCICYGYDPHFSFSSLS